MHIIGIKEQGIYGSSHEVVGKPRGHVGEDPAEQTDGPPLDPPRKVAPLGRRSKRVAHGAHDHGRLVLAVRLGVHPGDDVARLDEADAHSRAVRGLGAAQVVGHALHGVLRRLIVQVTRAERTRDATKVAAYEDKPAGAALPQQRQEGPAGAPDAHNVGGHDRHAHVLVDNVQGPRLLLGLWGWGWD